MSADIELNWEWAAGRAVGKKLLIKLDSVAPHRPGLFGFGKSPSFAGNIPKPVIVQGTVVNTAGALNGKTIKLMAPKPEVEGAALRVPYSPRLNALIRYNRGAYSNTECSFRSVVSGYRQASSTRSMKRNCNEL